MYLHLEDTIDQVPIIRGIDLLGLLLRLIFGNKYGKKTITLRGEKVKSRAEAKIANHFSRLGVVYKYEHRLRRGFLGKTIARPDFYLPDYNIYIEYWGLIHLPKYRRTMKWKMRQYHNRRIKFVSLYPDDLDNLDSVLRTKLEQFGIRLPVPAK